jgi:hypothetical protein
MLMLMVGLVVAGVGAALSGTLTSLLTPVLFVAVGAPFVVLALRGGNGHLLVGRSTSTGDLTAGIFGAAFVIGGLVWGAITGRRALSRFPGGNRLGALLAAIAGLGAALAIGSGLAGAVGSPPGGQLNGATGHTNAAGPAATAAAARKANVAVRQATSQAQKLTKLAACVTAAGANTSLIQRCEAKYMP